ncbi:MAG: hypothetical protein DRN01_02140 [Thermoplasmata archaeon]|nr:MAG: hypothetical protein DRN01_02140 [Thermoplasmata archaeon]
MDKKRLLVGVVLFGSLWGLSEVVLGSYLRDSSLPAGAIMTGIFAVGLMMMTRVLYRQPGMQLGMGLVAGGLRLFNPFVGCFICSAIAIMAEGAFFELIWYRMSRDLNELHKPTMSISMGVISAYTLYVLGFIVTQVLTPLLSSAGFHFENLVMFLPQILSKGLFAALLGGITVPVTLLLKNVDVSHVADKIYYTASLSVSALCWVAVVLNTFLMLSA